MLGQSPGDPSAATVYGHLWPGRLILRCMSGSHTPPGAQTPGLLRQAPSTCPHGAPPARLPGGTLPVGTAARRKVPETSSQGSQAPASQGFHAAVPHVSPWKETNQPRPASERTDRTSDTGHVGAARGLELRPLAGLRLVCVPWSRCSARLRTQAAPAPRPGSGGLPEPSRSCPPAHPAPCPLPSPSAARALGPWLLWGLPHLAPRLATLLL